MARLSHAPALDERWCKPLPVSGSLEGFVALLASEVEAVTQALRVYLVSASDQLDGRVVDLEEGIRLAAWANAGTLISVLPGRLAIYVGERLDETLVLQRPPA